jgi:hypothetical protein
MVEGMTKPTPEPEPRIRALIRTVALLSSLATEIRGLLIELTGLLLALASLVAAVAAMTHHWL